MKMLVISTRLDEIRQHSINECKNVLIKEK